MIRLGWMTDSTRVIGSTSMAVNMWRIFRMPAGLKTAMEDDIYRAKTYAAGPMMWKVIGERGKPVYALTRDPKFKAPSPSVTQCADAAELGARYATSEDELLVIGGKRVFELMLPFATTLHIAETTRTFPGNVVFDAWEKAPGFEVVSENAWAGGRTLKLTRPLDFVSTEKGIEK